MKVLTAHGMMRPVNAPLVSEIAFHRIGRNGSCTRLNSILNTYTRKKTDGERTATGVRRIEGKRLIMYRAKGKK